MRLKEWIAHERARGNKVTLSAIAEKINVTPANLSRAAAGKSFPTLENAQKISRLTGGAVGLFDWSNNGFVVSDIKTG